MTALSRQPEWRLFADGDSLYRDMLQGIDNATRSVHLESYIFANDTTGQRFIDHLCAKAQQGVEVRLHLDAIGSLGLLLSAQANRLKESGVELRWFNPPNHFYLPRLNRRNHRKLLVIDNHIAWLGGFNIQREYSREQVGDACWRDSHIRLEGPLANLAGLYFDKLWQRQRRWRPTSTGNESFHLISNQNLRQTHRFRRLLNRRIKRARNRVWLTTPYFTPDHRTRVALMKAAQRKVDVRLLVPMKSDQRLTQWAARAAYSRLLDAGVRIYEYCPSILHAKTAMIDASWATIGTANLDYRSFFVNYELNLVAQDTALCSTLAEHFTADLSVAREITKDGWRRRGRLRRLTEFIGWLARKWL